MNLQQPKAMRQFARSVDRGFLIKTLGPASTPCLGANKCCKGSLNRCETGLCAGQRSLELRHKDPQRAPADYLSPGPYRSKNRWCCSVGRASCGPLNGCCGENSATRCSGRAMRRSARRAHAARTWYEPMGATAPKRARHSLAIRSARAQLLNRQSRHRKSWVPLGCCQYVQSSGSCPIEVTRSQNSPSTQQKNQISCRVVAIRAKGRCFQCSEIKSYSSAIKLDMSWGDDEQAILFVGGGSSRCVSRFAANDVLSLESDLLDASGDHLHLRRARAIGISRAPRPLLAALALGRAA